MKKSSALLHGITAAVLSFGGSAFVLKIELKPKSIRYVIAAAAAFNGCASLVQMKKNLKRNQNGQNFKRSGPPQQIDSFRKDHDFSEN